MARNLEADLVGCKEILGKIADPKLRDIALAIFAPLGTKVPGPGDHARAYVLHADPAGGVILMHELSLLFERDPQALSLLLEAVNVAHAAYHAPQLNKGRLATALNQISSAALISSLKGDIFGKK